MANTEEIKPKKGNNGPIMLFVLSFKVYIYLS